MTDTLIHTNDMVTQPEIESPELKQNNEVEGDIVICVRKNKVWTIPIGGENDSLDS